MRVREQSLRKLKVNEGAFLYILRCADGSFYIGTTRTALEMRVAQHNAGTFGGYTATRLPVTLVFSQWFDRITDAIENERKLKKWSRAKKEAFVRGDCQVLRQLSARRSPFPSKPLRRLDKPLELNRQSARHGAEPRTVICQRAFT
jgi:putative endonuclease